MYGAKVGKTFNLNQVFFLFRLQIGYDTGIRTREQTVATQMAV